MVEQPPDDRLPLGRRALIRRAAILGAAAWTAPVILGSVTSPAGAVTGQCYIELDYSAATADPSTACTVVATTTTDADGCQPPGWTAGLSTLPSPTCFTYTCAYRNNFTVTVLPGGGCSSSSLVITAGTAEWLNAAPGNAEQACDTGSVGGGGTTITFSSPNNGSGRHWGRVRIIVSCS